MKFIVEQQLWVRFVSREAFRLNDNYKSYFKYGLFVWKFVEVCSRIAMYLVMNFNDSFRFKIIWNNY